MSMPYYVAPEQVMKDRADYARKGIARGRSLVGLVCADGILLCAENPSSTLRKVSEIYDRIAFAGVGRYNEFDQLRIAGVRAADLKGFSYSREDVDARSLAQQYAQILGQIFTHEMKPMEVEVLVAEVAGAAHDDQLFHVLYDGTVMDDEFFTVLGGDAEAINERMRASYAEGLDLGAALVAATAALSGPDRVLAAADLEVAVLDRVGGRRAFRRLSDDEVSAVLAAGRDGGGTAVAASPEAEPAEPEPAEAEPTEAESAESESGAESTDSLPGEPSTAEPQTDPDEGAAPA